MEYRYKTRGVCSSEILLELDGDVVKIGQIYRRLQWEFEGDLFLDRRNEGGRCHRTVQGHPVRL